MYPSSRNISDLCPNLQLLYRKFDQLMRELGVDYIVTCTYRNDVEQNFLYAQGRLNKGHIVTNAKAGQSFHNAVDDTGKPASKAFDIVIMKNGKPDWNISNPDWLKAGNIGRSVGLEWAGDWKSFKEYPHFQLPKE